MSLAAAYRLSVDTPIPELNNNRIKTIKELGYKEASKKLKLSISYLYKKYPIK